jgi:hypothetical protein
MEINLADDLMIGIRLIAKFIGVPERQAFYLAEKGVLPLFKMGCKWAGRKSTIARTITERENATTARQTAA